MKNVLFLLIVLVTVGGIAYSRWKERIRKQERVGFSYSEEAFRNDLLSRLFLRVKKQAEYADMSLHKATLYSLLLMIPGGFMGILFRNTELGLMISIFMAGIPFVVMIMLERKKQRLIMKESVPFLTSMDWAYSANSYSIPDTLQEIETSAPSVIRTEYSLMLQKIHTSVLPSIAMSELADHTRSPFLKVLAGILRAQEKRNDPKAFKKALKQLMNDILKTNNRLAKVTTTLNKKGMMLLGLFLTVILVYWITFMIMEHPMQYFRSSQGATALMIGTVAMLFPVSIYIMSALRRRF